MEGHIEITGCNLVELAKAAYALSKPQGLGFLHFKEGDELSDSAAYSMIEEGSRTPLRMDYVKGRAVKLTVIDENGSLYIRNKWFDHSDQDLKALLNVINA